MVSWNANEQNVRLCDTNTERAALTTYLFESEIAVVLLDTRSCVPVTPFSNKP